MFYTLETYNFTDPKPLGLFPPTALACNNCSKWKTEQSSRN